ncbi:MAG: apolipoprotein N-acyltransferase [Alphaproteobacteria bacterium]|nr:apolipoprotein N-acyltransferase [Alphaproteobacteria bacterium]
MVARVSEARVRPGSRIHGSLCRLARELAGLSGWRRYGVALLLGVIAVATLPPVDLSPLLVVAFTGLLWLDEGSSGLSASFGLGYAFGFGFFVAGLYWISGALLVDIAAFWWLVPIATMGLPAVFALYAGIALLAANLASKYLRSSGRARVFAFAIAWTVAEWIRGHACTGFPWNLIGSTWSGGFPGAIAVLQCVAWIGIYGLSFVTVLAASLPALLGASSLVPISERRRWMPAIGAALLVLLPGVSGAVRLELSPAAAGDIWLRIVQPAIPQTMKWKPGAAEGNLRKLLNLSVAASPRPIAAIIWPEAATPFFLERDAVVRREIAAIVPVQGFLITGALRASPPPGPMEQIWNSIEALNADGDVVAHYDKAHLVPFGEYLPIHEALPFRKITAGATDLSAGSGPRTIALPRLPPFAAAICYEAIFPGAIVNEQERPDWILNLTNDAWYGRSAGPFQHLASARTRTVEEGLPMVRVANNGISAVIDSAGRVRARINLDTIGYADVALPAPGQPTLYSRAGDWTLVALLLLGALPIVSRLH